MVQASKKISENDSRGPCDEDERGAHSEKNVRCGHFPGKR